MTATLYGEGSDHGQARVSAVVGKSDADHADERAARFRGEAYPDPEDRGEAVVQQLDRELAQARASRSGRTRTEAEYRANGLRVLKVRIPAAYLAKLDAICEDSGFSRADQLMGMIDSETEEWRKIRTKKAR